MFVPNVPDQLLAQAIVSAHTPTSRDEVLGAFSRFFALSVEAERVFLYLYDRAQRLLYTGADAGHAPDDAFFAAYWPAISTVLGSLQAQYVNGATVVPLATTSRTMGVVLVPKPTTHEQVHVLQALAHLLAGTLERLDLQGAFAEREREHAGLTACWRALLESRDVEEIAELAIDVARYLWNATGGMVFLQTEEGWLHPVERKNPQRRSHPAVPIAGSHIGAAMQRMEPLQFSLATQGWGRVSDAGWAAIVEVVVAPLWVNGQATGVLTLFGANPSFTPQQVRTIGGFANHLALAFNLAQRNQQRAGAPMLSRLTSREAEVLRLIAQGRSNQEIAQVLHITDRTVSTHLSNILRKLNLTSRTQAALYGLQHDFTT